MTRIPLALFLMLAALPVRAEVLVFAAASLKTALDELAPAYEAATGDRLVASLAGSSALAKQILAGAPADVFVSASPDWMDAVEAEGLIADSTRRDLLGNEIVLVAHEAGAPVSLVPGVDIAGLVGAGHLAMALVDSVPAGQYGKAALEALGVWEPVAPRVAQADNVRAALALVATGEAPFGIVYATDAAAEPGVHVVATFPTDSHPPITYPVAAIAGHEATAAPFLDFLKSPEAAAILTGLGFTVLP